MKDPRKRLRKQIFTSVVVLFSLLAIFGTAAGVKIFAQDTPQPAQTAAPEEISSEGAKVAGYAFLASAAAFGLGALGAGIAIGSVGSAAMGAVSEKPEVAGQALIFVALAEGLVVFGFITALMILGKV
ncbi:MAG: ATP synthase subunit C [Spirochaetota bacterium]